MVTETRTKTRTQKRYSVGFMFNQQKNYVALIRKARPDWQKGKMNGIGGHIEEGESPRDCMVREFFEETGYKTQPDGWIEFVVLRNDSAAYELHIF